MSNAARYDVAPRPASATVSAAGPALAAAAIALALGGWGVAADLVGATESPIWQLFLLGGNLPGPWVVGAFVIGAVAGRSGLQPWSGAVLAAGALVVADGLYYVGLVALGARSTTDAVASAATVWGWVAVVAGVALGAAGAIWARPDRHGERTGAVAMGLVAAVLIAEAIVLARGLDVSRPRSDGVRGARRRSRGLAGSGRRAWAPDVVRAHRAGARPGRRDRRRSCPRRDQADRSGGTGAARAAISPVLAGEQQLDAERRRQRLGGQRLLERTTGHDLTRPEQQRRA